MVSVAWSQRRVASRRASSRRAIVVLSRRVLRLSYRRCAVSDLFKCKYLRPFSRPLSSTLSLLPLPSLPSFEQRSGVARANFWPVLRSMPRGRRFRVPPSARRSSFDPFASGMRAGRATLRRARSLVRSPPRCRNILLPIVISYLPTFSSFHF